MASLPGTAAARLRTAAWYRAPTVALLALGIGVAAGRADLVILAAPLVLGAVLTFLAGRPADGVATAAKPTAAKPTAARLTAIDPDAGRPAASTPAARSVVLDSTFGSDTAVVRTFVRGTARAEFAVVVLPDPAAGLIGRPVVFPGAGVDQVVAVDARFRTKLWGPVGVARPDLLTVGPDGVHQFGAVRRGEVLTELVLPPVQAIAALPLPPITGGWAGAHVSRRPGQGSDLVDLREFAPGDRLRSVHWRSYARHQKLYTRRTLSDADAEIVICLDLSDLITPHRPAQPVSSGPRSPGRWC